MVMATFAAQRFGDDHMDGWGWGMMAVVFLVAVALIGMVVYFVARDTSARSQRSGPDALEILDQRFARGEIDEDEYRKRRAALRG